MRATQEEGEFAPGSRYSSLGAFVQDEVFALDPWFLTFGARWSLFDFSFDGFAGAPGDSGSFDALTAGFEAAREFEDGWRLVGSLSQGFRAPNLEDLASAGTFAGGEELPNPDLDPERSLTAELAVEVHRPRGSAALAVFATRIEDLVGRVLETPGPPGDEVFRRENVGRLDLVGAEAVARREFSRSLALDARLAWVRGREEDGLGGTVDARRIPPLHGRLALAWETGRAAARLGSAELVLSFAARQDELHPQDVSDPRIDPAGTPGWATLDLRLAGALAGKRDARWHVGLENVLDAAYRRHGSGVDGPGRGLVVGISLSF